MTDQPLQEEGEDKEEEREEVIKAMKEEEG